MVSNLEASETGKDDPTYEAKRAPLRHTLFYDAVNFHHKANKTRYTFADKACTELIKSYMY